MRWAETSNPSVDCRSIGSSSRSIVQRLVISRLKLTCLTTVRLLHCSRRTVDEVGSGIYGQKQLDDDDLTSPGDLT